MAINTILGHSTYHWPSWILILALPILLALGLLTTGEPSVIEHLHHRWSVSGASRLVLAAMAVASVLLVQPIDAGPDH